MKLFALLSANLFDFSVQPWAWQIHCCYYLKVSFLAFSFINSSLKLWASVEIDPYQPRWMGFLLTSQDGWAFYSWVTDIQASSFRVVGINQAQLGCIFTDLRAYEPLLKLTVIGRWRGIFHKRETTWKLRLIRKRNGPSFLVFIWEYINIISTCY